MASDSDAVETPTARRGRIAAKRKAATALEEFRAMFADRDNRVRTAFDSGINIRQIHLLSGLSRSLIYQIINRTPESEPEPEPEPVAKPKPRAKSARVAK